MPRHAQLPARSSRLLTPARQRRIRRPRVLLSALCLAALTACGGGSGSDSDSSSSTTSSITLTGVVARGAAVSGATVTAICASGTGSATSSSTGSYSLSVSGGALPCALKASASSGDLYSATTTTTANITTLTELMVAQLSGQTAASWYAAATASSVNSSVSSSSLSSAQAAVVSLLQAAGVSTSGLGDFVSSTLVAATSSSSGNSYDLVLDALQTALSSSGTSLSQLEQTVANTAAGSTTTTTASTSSESSSTSLLPADLLLKTKASNCDYLRSGTYRFVKFAPSVDTSATAEVTAIEQVIVDAATLTLTNASNSSDSWSWSGANGSCRYTNEADGYDIAVAPSGLIVARAYVGEDDDSVNTSARGSWRVILGIPEQTIALSELAGTWNTLNWQPSESDESVWTVEALSATFNSSGVVTALKCNSTISATPSASSCSGSDTPNTSIAVHDAGGFRINSVWDGANHYSRAFFFRSGTGALMGVVIDPDGQPTLLTPQTSYTLPSVGDSWDVRNIAVNSSLLAADSVQANTHTVTAVNSSDTSNGGSGSYNRSTGTTGSSTTTPQTLYANSGGTGYVYRPAASTTDSSGAAATVRAMYALPLKGTGLTAYWLPNTSSSGNNARFGLSVKAP